MQIYAHIALLDVENRLLLAKPDHAAWDVPGCAVKDDEPELALVRFLQDKWMVKTLAKALFPLTFCVAEDGVLHIVYGCRNWVGSHGLQQAQAHGTGAELIWIRPVRLLDHMVTDTCKLLAPVLMSLI